MPPSLVVPAADTDAVLESVPELQWKKPRNAGEKPPFTAYYKAWPGGRHDEQLVV